VASGNEPLCNISFDAMAEKEAIGSQAAQPVTSYGTTSPQQHTMATAGPNLPFDKPLEDKVWPSPLSGCLCCTLCPIAIFSGIKQLEPNQQAAILYFGEYKGTLKDAGLYWVNPCGLQMRMISTKRQTLQLKDIKVLDAKGNPICVSGVVTFYGTSAKKATIDVDNPWPMMGRTNGSYLDTQAAAVLKRVASRFPYEAGPGIPSLQTEGSAIAEELKVMLQEKVSVAGIDVFSFDLVDLSYASEIAQVMLVRQQAEALVDARRHIVMAAVDMTNEAVSQLRKSGEPLDDKTCQQVTTNLLTVICSQATATPTVSMNT